MTLKNPYLNSKNLVKIKNWKSWEPSLEKNDNPSETAYLKYLGAEQKLIEAQEAEEDSPALSDDDLNLTLNRARSHLCDAAVDFAAQVDFKKWVQRVVDEAEKNGAE